MVVAGDNVIDVGRVSVACCCVSAAVGAERAGPPWGGTGGWRLGGGEALALVAGCVECLVSELLPVLWQSRAPCAVVPCHPPTLPGYPGVPGCRGAGVPGGPTAGRLSCSAPTRSTWVAGHVEAPCAAGGRGLLPCACYCGEAALEHEVDLLRDNGVAGETATTSCPVPENIPMTGFISSPRASRWWACLPPRPTG